MRPGGGRLEVSILPCVEGGYEVNLVCSGHVVWHHLDCTSSSSGKWEHHTVFTNHFRA